MGKGAYLDDQGCYCAIGAIGDAIGVPWQTGSDDVPDGSYSRMAFSEYIYFAESHISPDSRVGGDDELHEWSDRPERTAEEVTDLFDRAAQTLEDQYTARLNPV